MNNKKILKNKIIKAKLNYYRKGIANKELTDVLRHISTNKELS